MSETTRILFAVTPFRSYPILATEGDDGDLRWSIDGHLADMDEHFDAAMLKLLPNGLHVWEGEFEWTTSAIDGERDLRIETHGLRRAMVNDAIEFKMIELFSPPQPGSIGEALAKSWESKAIPGNPYGAKIQPLGVNS